jgi:hypothetical protein
MVEGLGSPTRELREAAAEQIRQDQQSLIGRLINYAAAEIKPLPSSVGDSTSLPWHDSKHLAILLLGDLRAPEAIPALLKNLEYRNPRKFLVDGYELGPVEGPGWHPAVESLIKIGMPAVGPAIEKLGAYTQDCLGRRLCIVVLKQVLGPRLAKVRLEMAVDEAKDDAARANLKAALEQLEPEPQPAEPPGR